MSSGSRIYRWIRVPVALYLMVVLLMTFLETWLVYPAPSLDQGEWNPKRFDYAEVEFASADGTKLHGWLFEHPEPQHVILYLHGNGEDVAANGDYMDYLRSELSATVLIFELSRLWQERRSAA